MKQVVSPCSFCKDRFVGCHSECKSYLEYKDYREEVRKAKVAHIKIENDIRAVQYARKRKR